MRLGCQSISIQEFAYRWLEVVVPQDEDEKKISVNLENEQDNKGK